METKFSEYLNFVINYLIDNQNITSDPSLQTGRFGMVLCLYSIASVEKNNEVKKKADLMLSSLFKQAVGHKKSSFHAISAPGIYWGVCYLVNQGLLDLNVDELFNDIDDAYSTQLQQHRNLFTNLNVSSLTHFLIERYKCAFTRKSRVIVQKSLIDIVDLIDEKVNHINLRVNQLCSYHFLLKEILIHNIYPEIVGQLLAKITDLIVHKAKTCTLSDPIDLLKVAVVTGETYSWLTAAWVDNAFALNKNDKGAGMSINEMYTIEAIMKGHYPNLTNVYLDRLNVDGSITAYVVSRIQSAREQCIGIRNIGLVNDGIAAIGLVLLEKLYNLSFNWRAFNYCHKDCEMT